MSQWSFHTNCRGWAICKSSDLSPVLLCMCIWYMPVCVHTEAKGSTLGALLYWPPSLFSEFPCVHVSVGGACGGSWEDSGLSGAVSCVLRTKLYSSSKLLTAERASSAAPSLPESGRHQQTGWPASLRDSPTSVPPPGAMPGFLCGHWSSGSTLPSPWIFSKRVIGRGRAGCPIGQSNLISFKLCVHV